MSYVRLMCCRCHHMLFSRSKHSGSLMTSKCYVAKPCSMTYVKCLSHVLWTLFWPCVLQTTTMMCTDGMQVLGHNDTLAYESWPQHDEALLVEDKVNLPIQVNCRLSMLKPTCGQETRREIQKGNRRTVHAVRRCDIKGVAMSCS